MSPSGPNVVIAGGGVAALEAVLALRALTGPRAAITMLAPERDFSPPPVSVATPFGFGPPPTLPLVPFADEYDVELRRGYVDRVDPAARVLVPTGGQPIAYDHLLIAVGARRRAAVRGALTFREPRDAEAIATPLADVAGGQAGSLAIAVPSVAAWSLPAYELAVMAAVELRARGMNEPAVALVTPEERPLGVFGRTASDAVADLLAERGITFHGGCTPFEVTGGELRLREGGAIAAGRVVALPEAVGPYLRELPPDSLGFIPTDEHALVAGYDDVYAAGDTTTFPLRQGGLAAQQADAAAESIARAIGVVARARPFRPVLRAMLLTGGAPLYLRTVVGEPDGAVSRRPLWWPPGKVAGRYLAPLMATAKPRPVTARPLEDIGAVGSRSSAWGEIS